MQLRWFKGIPEKDKGVMKARIMESYDVLSQMRVLLEDDLAKSYSSMDTDYGKPAWSQYQASKLGEQTYIRRMLELINIEDK